MVKTKYQNIPDGCFANYFNFLIGRIFKVLPLSEEENQNIINYMESLQRELIGNLNLVEELKCEGYFILLLNKIEYLINEKYTHDTLRKEIFECISCVEKLRDKYNLMRGEEVGEL
jgi:hypothetical protein